VAYYTKDLSLVIDVLVCYSRRNSPAAAVAACGTGGADGGSSKGAREGGSSCRGEGVVKQGLVLLSAAALKSSALCKVLCGDSGRETVVRLLVRAMAHFPRSPDVQVSATGLMWTMSFGAPGVKRLVGDAGGIQAILAAMAAHAGDASVHEVASGALKNLTVLRDNALSLVELGGIDVVCGSMRAHASSGALQEQAAALVRNLALMLAAPPESRAADAAGAPTGAAAPLNARRVAACVKVVECCAGCGVRGAGGGVRASLRQAPRGSALIPLQSLQRLLLLPLCRRRRRRRLPLPCYVRFSPTDRSVINC